MTERFIDLDLEVGENLEDQMEAQWERKDVERFSNEVLFCVQGLGSVQTFKTEDGQNQEIYVKGEHCEPSLKDLCRFCKKDEPENPLTRLVMANWKVLQKDLISLLICYPQDKVLTYYVVILLESMTNKHLSGVGVDCNIKHEIRDQMEGALQDYKIAFIKPLVFETLMHHFQDCILIPTDQRTKVHTQMIELIILITRNLLSVPDIEENTRMNNEFKKSLQKTFIEVLIEEQVLAAMIYISQDFESPLMQKLSLVIVEIFYYIFTPFDPESLLKSKQQEKQYYIQNFHDEQTKRNRTLGSLPARHSRFNGIYYRRRDFDPSCKILSSPYQPVEIDKHPRQTFRPVQVKILSKFRNILPKHIEFDSSDQQTSFKEQMCSWAIDFMQHGFSRLIDCVYNQIYTNNDELIESSDRVHYFVLIAFFLKFARFYCKRNIETLAKQLNSELSSEFVYVSAALQLTQFELIYSQLLAESTKTKKTKFDYRNYFAVITILIQFLHIVRDLSLSSQQQDRKNAQILMQNIFNHDISKALRIGFSYCTYGMFNDEMLKVLMRLTSLFFDLLENYSQGYNNNYNYSKGKTLNIKTNKLLKKKLQKKKANKNKHNEDIDEENPEEQNEPRSEDEDSDDDDDDEPQYKERKFNLMSEFAIVVEYTVMEKVFYLISNDKMATNDSELNSAVYKYFKRIVDLLSAEWMFYQIQFLWQINVIMANREIKLKGELQPLFFLFRRIVKGFLATFSQNSMLAVEALFRFTDSFTKDQILSNYAEQPQNDDIDVVHENHNQLQQIRWTQQEDLALIENYSKFKDCENPEEQLSLFLSSLGFDMKPVQHIRKRLKKFHLSNKENTEQAMQLYNETYEKIKIKKEEAFQKYVSELVADFGQEEVVNQFNSIFNEIEECIRYRDKQLFEMPIPPQTPQQFDFFDRMQVQQLFFLLDFKQPGQGEIYWRLCPHTQLEDIANFRNKIATLANNPNPIDQIIPTLTEDNVRTLQTQEFKFTENIEEDYQRQSEEISEQQIKIVDQYDDYNDIFD